MPSIAAGNTSNVLAIGLGDANALDGSYKSGLVYSSSPPTCYYKRSNGTASVAVTLADIPTLGTFVSGGFKEIDSAHMPGWYEFHPPDAALATGATSVDFYFLLSGTITPTVLHVDLTSSPTVTLASSQPNYAPAKAGDKMDIVNVPNATAVTALQSGLATSSGLNAVQTHGDTAWATATGFATSSALAGLITTVGVAGVGLTNLGDSRVANLDLAVSTRAAAFTTVVLAASQPNYAPSKAGDKMDLINAPNATAVTALQSGLATSTALGGLITTVGAAGAGLTALGDARLVNLDTTVSSRLADSSYTAPFNSTISTIASALAGLVTTVGTAGAGLTAVQLAANGLDAVLVESGISAGAGLVDDSATQLTSINARQTLALIQSACCAILAGAEGTTITIAAAGKSSPNRITAIVDGDGNGNRTSVSLRVPN